MSVYNFISFRFLEIYNRPTIYYRDIQEVLIMMLTYYGDNVGEWYLILPKKTKRKTFGYIKKKRKH